MALPLNGGAPILVAAGGGNGRFSPNANWLVYQSGGEIYVQPFPGSTESRRKASISGGTLPHWSHDGREIYFLSPDNHLMVASVALPANGEDIAIGTPKPLFPTPLPNGSRFAPAPDGERFLINAPTEEVPPIIVLSNWARNRQ